MMDSLAALRDENIRFAGSGGRSEENHGQGFIPAFRDADTGAVYRSCFGDGRPAPFHLLDGLPDEAVVLRSPTGRVAVIKPSIVSGFLCRERFYTREEAAACMACATSSRRESRQGRAP